MVRREAIETAIPSCSFHLFQCPRSQVRFIIVKVRLLHVYCVYKKQKSLKSTGIEKVKWDHKVKASKSLIKCFQIYISWNIQLIQNGKYGWYSNDWSINSLIAQLASVVSFPRVSSSQLSSVSVCYQCVISVLLSAVPAVLCLPIFFNLLFLLFILFDPAFPVHQCFRS